MKTNNKLQTRKCHNFSSSCLNKQKNRFHVADEQGELRFSAKENLSTSYDQTACDEQPRHPRGWSLWLWPAPQQCLHASRATPRQLVLPGSQSPQWLMRRQTAGHGQVCWSQPSPPAVRHELELQTGTAQPPRARTPAVPVNTIVYNFTLITSFIQQQIIFGRSIKQSK